MFIMNWPDLTYEIIGRPPGTNIADTGADKAALKVALLRVLTVKLVKAIISAAGQGQG